MNQEAIGRSLLPGERILWEGRPSTGLILRPIDALVIPFSLLWGGFALFWNISVWTAGAGVGWGFKLFGLVLLVIGLYAIVGRFWLDMLVRRRLTYLVTIRRIIILRRGSSTAKSLDIKRLPALELQERSDGSGTIRFGAGGNWFSGNNFGIWQPSFDPTPQFLRIAHARTVYQLIEKHGA